MQEGIEEVSYDADDGDVPVWLVCVCVCWCVPVKPPLPSSGYNSRAKSSRASISFLSESGSQRLSMASRADRNGLKRRWAGSCVCVCSAGDGGVRNRR